ncbi:serine hydrolase [Cupriavidus necator]
MSFSRLLRRIGLSLTFFGVFSQNLSAAEPPRIAARAYILLDGKSHRVLLEKNADERLQPASLTKLMTAYIVLDALSKRSIRWEQLVSVSADIAIVAGDEATMQAGSDTLKPMIDDANALCSELAGLVIAMAGSDANSVSGVAEPALEH